MTDGMGTGRRVIALVAAAGVIMIAAVPAQGASQPRWMGLFRAINKVRANHGLHPIVISTRLHLVARRHSNDMLWRGYFAHTSPTGPTLTQRVMTSGFVQAWLKSPKHRAIMLSSRYHLVGIGRAYGTFLGHPGASVWTVDWGHR